MKTIETILLIIFILTLFIIGFLLGGLIWMVGLGLLAQIFQAPNLAIGYWQSVVVAVIVSLLFGGFSSIKGEK